MARQFLEILQQQPPLLIAVTGYGQEGDRERTRAAGFSAHLVKPIDVEQILAVIDSLALRQPA